MGAAMGREADIVAFFAELAEAPYRFDFYQTLRRLECLYSDKPRWGQALRPVDERVRLGQDPDLSFAPAPLASFDPGRDGHPPRLQVRLFGLLGPNGPLPLHITEYARERLRNAGDPTFSRFLDLFHHRFLALFYRAWAQAQPHVNRDRPEADRFGAYIGSFIGVAPAAFRHRDALPDVAKFFHVGALVRQVRNGEGLASILEHFFRVPVQIEDFVGHWLPLGEGERTYLGREGATLGSGAVVGKRVWDRQHKFRVRLGPLTLREYESMLPGGTPMKKLVDWVRLYCCLELDWDVRLLLDKTEVPPLKLGIVGRLGWTTWLGTRQADRDADDLCLHAETFAGPIGVAAA
ncbi:MAG: type VI secretion system baseplate subunit TssG [Vicinamibacterales bacterium]